MVNLLTCDVSGKIGLNKYDYVFLSEEPVSWVLWHALLGGFGWD